MGLAAVVGASGGIGRALADNLEERGGYDRVLRLSRSQDADILIDITDENSVAAAAGKVGQLRGDLTMCIVATGLLHQGGKGPEKALSKLDPDWMIENYRINAVGPAIIAKHFLPIMPRRGKFHFAAISARVGSISDNRLGGWHSYRASKTALNMIIRNLAIETARRNKSAVIAALHPGTVNTSLSLPFQRNLAESKLFSPEFSAAQLIDVLTGLNPSDSGGIYAWDGVKIEP